MAEDLHKVTLNVYKVPPEQNSPDEDVEYIWHTSVSVYGFEYFCSPENGIQQHPVATQNYGELVSEIFLGMTETRKEDFNSYCATTPDKCLNSDFSFYALSYLLFPISLEIIKFLQNFTCCPLSKLDLPKGHEVILYVYDESNCNARYLPIPRCTSLVVYGMEYIFADRCLFEQFSSLTEAYCDPFFAYYLGVTHCEQSVFSKFLEFNSSRCNRVDFYEDVAQLLVGSPLPNNVISFLQDFINITPQVEREVAPPETAEQYDDTDLEEVKKLVKEVHNACVDFYESLPDEDSGTTEETEESLVNEHRYLDVELKQLKNRIHRAADYPAFKTDMDLINKKMTMIWNEIFLRNSFLVLYACNQPEPGTEAEEKAEQRRKVGDFEYRIDARDSSLETVYLAIQWHLCHLAHQGNKEFLVVNNLNADNVSKLMTFAKGLGFKPDRTLHNANGLSDFKIPIDDAVRGYAKRRLT